MRAGSTSWALQRSGWCASSRTGESRQASLRVSEDELLAEIRTVGADEWEQAIERGGTGAASAGE